MKKCICWCLSIIKLASVNENSLFLCSPKFSLPCLQRYTSWPYPEPDVSAPHPHTVLVMIFFVVLPTESWRNASVTFRVSLFMSVSLTTARILTEFVLFGWNTNFGHDSVLVKVVPTITDSNLRSGTGGVGWGGGLERRIFLWSGLNTSYPVAENSVRSYRIKSS